MGGDGNCKDMKFISQGVSRAQFGEEAVTVKQQLQVKQDVKDKPSLRKLKCTSFCVLDLNTDA